MPLWEGTYGDLGLIQSLEVETKCLNNCLHSLLWLPGSYFLVFRH